MALTKYKLGNLIELSDERNSELQYGINDVKGISIQKVFIETKADMTGVSLKPYILVKPDYFAYVTVTSRNGEKITISHNDTDSTYIVSSYIVFKVKLNELLLSDYLFMYFNRPEFDRYSRFNSWGSARETFSWEDMCDIEIYLPPLSVQQKYVDIYNAMLENQRCYERGLEDLKLSFDALLDSFKKKSARKNVGDLLEEIDERNTDNTYNEVFGVNITKQFMPSVASSKDVHNYKIVRKNQFVYSGMQTGRDECIRIALLDKEESLIVSPAYSVLQVRNDYVIPEYIQMWFSRSEMDRLGWFMSDSSIRSNLDLPRFFEIEIPVPMREEQNALVSLYKAYTLRRTINERLKEQIKKMCPVLIKGALEEGEKYDI